MKKIILGIMIGIILCSGIVYAASYLAADITYTPSNESWEVSNVSEALNDLYSNVKENEETQIEYKTATKTQSYNISAGYAATVNVNFSDVFPNSLLGVISLTNSAENPCGGFHGDRKTAVSINSSAKTVSTNVYGGYVGTDNNENISGTITVVAIGY